MVENRKRKNQIKIYLNDEEVKKLEKKIELFGKSKSEFIRQSVLNSEPTNMKIFNLNYS